MNEFLESDGPMQILLVLAIFIISWHAVWNHKPRDPALRSMHLEKISFFVLLWFIGILGSLLYSVVVLVWPVFLVALAAVAWNLTALSILAIGTGSRLMRLLSAIPILLIFVLLPKYSFYMSALVVDIDRVLICGPAVPLEKCAVVKSTAPTNQEGAKVQGASAQEEWGGVRVKPSSIVRGVYFFVSLFVVLSYFGQVYRIWHESQLVRFSDWALDTSVVNNLVIVMAFSVSMIVGLFFAGADLPSLGIFSGLLAAGVSIALRDMLQNSIAGMLLIWDKTIRKDDVITIGGSQYGWVDRITLRYTLIKDRNDINTLIPNSTLISGTIQNWTHGKSDEGKSNVRLKLDVGVAYSTDVSNAITRLAQAARRVKRVLRKPPPLALVIGMGESSINLQLRFWINDPKEGIRNVLSQVYLEVLDEFDREEPRKISIPFPQREVRVVGASQQDSTALAAA